MEATRAIHLVPATVVSKQQTMREGDSLWMIDWLPRRLSGLPGHKLWSLFDQELASTRSLHITTASNGSSGHLRYVM